MENSGNSTFRLPSSSLSLPLSLSLSLSSCPISYTLPRQFLFDRNATESLIESNRFPFNTEKLHEIRKHIAKGTFTQHSIEPNRNSFLIFIIFFLFFVLCYFLSLSLSLSRAHIFTFITFSLSLSLSLSRFFSALHKSIQKV